MLGCSYEGAGGPYVREVGGGAKYPDEDPAPGVEGPVYPEPCGGG
jgi:hypothetical protein